MPNFNDIQKEIQQQNAPESTHDLVRRKYLKKLYEKTGRNVILYYSGWLQKPSPNLARTMSINDDDKNGFMNAINGMDVGKGLDIILHTPGGEIAATESLIDYLNRKFNGDMRAIVPQLAMSGGTIITCACKEILMGKQSSLGPIDPQIDGYPASGIMSEFNNAIKDIKKDRAMAYVWQPILAEYSPALIEKCKKAIAWSKELAETYLKSSMFHDDMTKDPAHTNAKISTIVRLLTDQDVTKSHFRHIPTSNCIDAGLKIVEIEEDDELQDIILSIHHATALTIMNTRNIKIIENQNSHSYISQYMDK